MHECAVDLPPQRAWRCRESPAANSYLVPKEQLSSSGIRPAQLAGRTLGVKTFHRHDGTTSPAVLRHLNYIYLPSHPYGEVAIEPDHAPYFTQLSKPPTPKPPQTVARPPTVSPMDQSGIVVL